MIFREAEVSDILQMQIVRHSVKENILSNPAMVQIKIAKSLLLYGEKDGFVRSMEM